MRHRKEAREKGFPSKDSEAGTALTPEGSCVAEEEPLMREAIDCRAGLSCPSHVVTSPCHLLFRIFVNRSLALEKIKCFGFDMDYTLASK